MALIEGLEHIPQKKNIFFVHQTGAADEKIVKAAYQRHDISCTVQSFFDDMAVQYQKADLIICRAGATTVAEVKNKPMPPWEVAAAHSRSSA